MINFDETLQMIGFVLWASHLDMLEILNPAGPWRWSKATWQKHCLVFCLYFPGYWWITHYRMLFFAFEMTHFADYFLLNNILLLSCLVMMIIPPCSVSGVIFLWTVLLLFLIWVYNFTKYIVRHNAKWSGAEPRPASPDCISEMLCGT